AAVRAKAAKAAAEKAAKAAAAKAAAQAKAEAAAAAKERALNGPYDETDVRSNCKRVVVENLTSPSTAKWPGWFEEMDHAPRRWPKQHEWKYVNHVDSQNGFGAMVRTNFECLVFDDGQVKVNFLD
ncbi:MAG TPA: hypothetical protein VHN99_08145, partial [Deinococcales bacterium]|nr:hypothetical protein [Deinococcales bacterium]